jgi:TRAP-type C4-dicarboxylate transport system substrate-binding protein
VKKIVGLVVLMAALLSVSFIGCAAEEPAPTPTPEEEGPIEWLVQTMGSYQTTEIAPGIIPGYYHPLHNWKLHVEDITNGRMRIVGFSPGSIAGLQETMNAVMTGVLDGFDAAATAYGGDIPEGFLCYGVPSSTQNIDECWEIMFGDPKYQVGKIVQEAFHEKNIHWAGWQLQGPNQGFGNFRIEKLSDFAGHKMRASGPQATWFENFGGVGVTVPWDDIYMGIKLGTIEGTFCDAAGVEFAKFYEVVKYSYFPPWNATQHTEILVNLDSWNALPKDIQDTITAGFKDDYYIRSELHLGLVDLAYQHLEEWGAEEIYLPAEEVAGLDKRVIEEVWPKIAALSPRCEEGMKIFKQWVIDKGRYTP